MVAAKTLGRTLIPLEARATRDTLRWISKEVRPTFSHVDEKGELPKMVDVSEKSVTLRKAHARSVVRLGSALQQAFRDQVDRKDGGKTELQSAKGPIFSTAIVAGTMAVKKTSELIPFCHPIAIEGCDFDIRLGPQADEIVIDCIVSVHHKTGVEMEALTGSSVAALCVYDMCKSISHDMSIQDTILIRKEGGKSSPSPSRP